MKDAKGANMNVDAYLDYYYGSSKAEREATKAQREGFIQGWNAHDESGPAKVKMQEVDLAAQRVWAELFTDKVDEKGRVDMEFVIFAYASIKVVQEIHNIIWSERLWSSL